VTVLRSGSATDVGRVRTVNQDIPLERPNLFAVADGMGGHAGGEVAARVAVETLEQAFERAPTSDGLRHAFSEANTAIWQESQANLDLRGMGTTLTAVALVGGPDGQDVLALGNVGDSRAYVFSDGQMVQVTDDHSLAEERMRQGEMTEAEAAIHPQRHILTRALGVSTEVEADMWELHLRTGDRLLLCSDGLSNEVGTDEMAEILEEMDDPGEAAHRLVEVANEHGGSDNITVVIVDIQVGEEGNGKPTFASPLAVLPIGATAATEAVGSPDPDPDPEGEGDGEGEATGSAAADLAATSLLTAPLRDDKTAVVPAADALSRGARLGFGDDKDHATLAEEGPHSDEFFVGSVASVPLSRSTARVPPAPATSAPARSDEKESRGARRRRLGIPRRITLRVIGFVLLVVAVPVGVYFAIKWYAYDNWYVTLQHDQIVVKQGQQGGVLWFKPKVVDHTGDTSSQVPNQAIAPLRAGVQEGSLAGARAYVRRLLNEATTTTTTTIPKTTTTVPSNHFVPAPTTPTTALPPPATTTTTTTAVATAAVQTTVTQFVQTTSAVTAAPAATGGTP
jgi:serine/threonine protein phosphatase PrpC